MKCRICGCIDEDCRQCIEAQGFPCSWAEPDLCTRCRDELEEQAHWEIKAALEEEADMNASS